MYDGHYIYVIYNTTFYVLHKVTIDFSNFHWEHVFIFQIITLFARINVTSCKTNFVPYYVWYYDKYLPLQLKVISYISSQYNFTPILTYINVFRPITFNFTPNSSVPSLVICIPYPVVRSILFWIYNSLGADTIPARKRVCVVY